MVNNGICFERIMHKIAKIEWNTGSGNNNNGNNNNSNNNESNEKQINLVALFELKTENLSRI